MNTIDEIAGLNSRLNSLTNDITSIRTTANAAHSRAEDAEMAVNHLEDVIEDGKPKKNQSANRSQQHIWVQMDHTGAYHPVDLTQCGISRRQSDAVLDALFDVSCKSANTSPFIVIAPAGQQTQQLPAKANSGPDAMTLNSRQSQAANPTVGQIWIDRDPRRRGTRTITIEKIDGKWAVCRSSVGNHRVNILLNRFNRYELVQDVLPI
jgi:hypothetical protein